MLKHITRIFKYKMPESECKMFEKLVDIVLSDKPMPLVSALDDRRIMYDEYLFGLKIEAGNPLIVFNPGLCILRAYAGNKVIRGMDTRDSDFEYLANDYLLKMYMHSTIITTPKKRCLAGKISRSRGYEVNFVRI